jgi:hypothetical protein
MASSSDAYGVGVVGVGGGGGGVSWLSSLLSNPLTSRSGGEGCAAGVGSGVALGDIGELTPDERDDLSAVLQILLASPGFPALVEAVDAQLRLVVRGSGQSVRTVVTSIHYVSPPGHQLHLAAFHTTSQYLLHCSVC